jgi:Zn-dependent peptidase ImmA (M78 family)
MAVRWTLLKNKAKELLEKSNIRKAPVPVEKLASALNAIVRYQPFDGDVSGLVHNQDSQAVIGVNSNHAETRQRFTIAHEIGHLLLHHSESLHVDNQLRSVVNFRDEVSSLGVDDSEIEANQFAAELLMPEEFILRDLKEISATEPEAAVEELAQRYRVSIQSMAIRLSKLGFIR